MGNGVRGGFRGGAEGVLGEIEARWPVFCGGGYRELYHCSVKERA